MKKKTLVVLLGVIAICFLAVFAINVSHISADAENWSDEQIAESYTYGTEFSIPEKTVTVGGKTEKATASVVLPDGSATYAAKITLNRTGSYRVNYSATVNGKVYSETHEFRVISPLFSHSDKSSVGYGKVIDYDNVSETETSGLIVSLSQGDEFTFNQFIDASSLTSATTFLKLFALTGTKGSAEFARFNIMLYDSEDPSVYVKIVAKQRDRNETVAQYGQTHVFAGANGQDMVGDENGTVHINDEIGQLINHTFDGQHKIYVGKDDSGNIIMQALNLHADALPMDIRFDYESKGIYIVNKTYNRKGDFNGNEMKFVTDLDNPKYYSNLFAGFPSGKIKLGISAGAYNAATARFCISDVFGMDITATELNDVNAPEITVNTDYEEMPAAKIGTGYPVPSASAKDDYTKNCDVEVKVYYNYMGETPISVNIRDGKFVPAKEGFYAIVYRTSDDAGNKAEKVLWVRAENEIPALSVAVTGAYDREVSLGEIILPAKVTVTGGSGISTIKYYASTNGVEEIEATNGFIPEKEDVWTIKAVATDYIGNTASASYEITASRSDLPILTDNVVLQKIYVSGAAYVLPVAYVKDYSSGVRENKLCDVEIEDANGKNTYKAGDKFTPKVTGDYGEIKVSYKYNGTTFTTETIPAIRPYTDGMSLRADNYFYGEGLVKTATADGMSIKTPQKTDKASFLFANTLIAEDFSIAIRSIATRTNFDEIRITLTDAENYDASATVRFINGGDYVMFVVGDSSLRIEKTFSEVNDFPIGYKKGYFTLDKTQMEVKSTDNGEAFNGFGEKVYLSVEFIGAKTQAELLVVSINDCPFTQATDDVISPKHVINGASGGNAPKDSLYVLPSITVGDVFSPNVTATLSVRDADGKFVTDENGLKLQSVDPFKEYTIKLTEYGRYRIIYTIGEDEEFNPTPNIQTRQYTLTVFDEMPPEITLTSGYTKTVKVGEYIILPDIKVSDNVSAEENITIVKMVINPNGRQIHLTEGNAVRALYEGVYEIQIVATDEIGNMNLIKLYVTVTK